MEFAWQQTAIFLWSMAVGAGIMMCYDVFRILRAAFQPNDVCIFIEDVIFFVIAGLATWFYLLESCHGELRGFVMVGEGIGGLLYFLTVGRAVMGVARPLIRFFQGVIERLILRPARWMWKVFQGLLQGLARMGKRLLKVMAKIFGVDRAKKVLQNRKKIKENTKIHLPEGRNLLYNLYVICFSRFRPGKSSHKGNQTQEVEKNEEPPKNP